MPFLPWVATTANAPTPLSVGLGGTGAATVAGALADLGMAGPLNDPIPSDISTWLAWTSDPGAAGAATGALTSGTIVTVEVWLRTAVTTSNVIVAVAVAGATLTANQNFIALYDSTGTRQAVTADQSGVWTATGAFTAAWTSAFAAPAGKYYIAVLSNGTTPPSFRASSSAPSLANGGLSGANLRFGVGPAAQTAMPASLTLSSLSGTNAVGLCAILS